MSRFLTSAQPHAVGYLVYDPGLVIIQRINRHRFDTHRNLGDQNGILRVGDIEDRKTIVGCIYRKQASAVGRETDRRG